jgi:hypothetical protein
MSAGRHYRRLLRRRRALLLLPQIPDAAPAALKDALAVRNEASATGCCPGCGAEARLLGTPRPGEIVHAVFAHEAGCPALLEEAP